MRKLILILIVVIGGPLLVLAVLWSQKTELLDFVSDVERIAAAPAPKTFGEVVVGEQTEVAESLPAELPPASDPAEHNPPESEVIDNTEGAEVVSDREVNEDGVVLIPEKNESIPSEFNLAVPFVSQSPSANWDAVHEETCEEAAIFMVHEFYQGVPAGLISVSQAEEELMKIVEFEKALFGFFESTTAAQIAVLVEQMYGYERVEIIENPTVENLKTHIVAGRPVIVPTAGRLLGNPNFRGEGPLYHALVLKGYTETTFVTNDPGTRRGADYQYNFDIVMNAMHDWNGREVLSGAKVVVVIYPNE